MLVGWIFFPLDMGPIEIEAPVLCCRVPSERPGETETGVPCILGEVELLLLSQG